MSDIAMIITMIAGPRENQNRLVISSSSGFRTSSGETIFGSSAIPHIRHTPGFDSTTSGSIGQMYSTTPPN
jgi:hypothetical protein